MLDTSIKITELLNITKLSYTAFLQKKKHFAYPSESEFDVDPSGGVEVFGLVWVDALEHHGGITLLLEVDKIAVVAVHLNVLMVIETNIKWMKYVISLEFYLVCTLF